ncbi:O-antigen ligase family protein [Clostridium lacusfryxellense]|uniref:O-antigen ligase family protein n=1 Tax=Clostridium lacusfryxellense TaxID=205328 RepID=UPI001C0DDF65|nr:O-antigen ligase family protein [Clostridium lacusfryxellense]MBU3111457.1 O-antigen ligase family protein [Clostridium lacusfryxellense]
MDSTLSFHKRFWVIELICVILIATTMVFNIKAVGLFLAFSEIIAIGVFLNMFIYHGLYKRDYKFTPLSKRVFWILFAFGIYFIVLFGVRIMLHLSFTDSIWPIRGLVLGSSIFFIIDRYKPKVNQLLCGAMFIYTALNVRELIDCITSPTIRDLLFLGNINIYLYVSTMLITFAIWAIKESNEKGLPSWITPIAYVNVGMSLVFAFLSGGRLGWVVMGAVIVASFLLIFGAKWNSWKRILAFMIACSLVIILAASVNFMQARASLYRSFSAIVTRIPGLAEEPTPDGEEEPVSTADASDKIRQIFWTEAWKLIKKNPVIGAGTFAVAYKQAIPSDLISVAESEEIAKMQRPAHNFILETWMGWGLGGLILYIAGLCSTCYYVLKKLVNIPIRLRFCCIMPIVAAAFISLLQSFILLSFYATYLMWFTLGFASMVDYYYKQEKMKNI